MRLRIAIVSNAIHPNQVSVSIRAIDGEHFLVVNRVSLVSDDMIEVGGPLATRGEELLVELPAETDDGAWRLWVNKNSIDDHLEAAE